MAATPAAPHGAARPHETFRRALRTRYRREIVAGDVPGGAVLDTILAHHSVRSYRPERLADGVLETIVAAAQSAPTSSNLQAWSVVAVEDAERRARLAELAGQQRQVVEAPLLLVWIADLSRARQIARGLGRPSDGLDYTESFVLAVIDAALAAQNAVLAIQALGLGSCYIGAMRNAPEAVAAELGLPPEAFAVFGLTVGHPDRARASDVKPRLPQTAVLHRERYGVSAPAEELAHYNGALRAFQAEQDMPAADWTETVSSRIGSAAALKGRDGLKRSLRTLGFALK